MPFSYLKEPKPISTKLNKIFIVDSHINNIPGHHERIKLISKLNKSYFDLFGSILWGNHTLYKGQINDFKYLKQQDYKYSLIIENQHDNIYWSEKITDSILAYSFPFYYGSESINTFFPEGSFYNIKNLDTTTSEIDYVLKNINDFVNLDSIKESRDLILYKYNMLNIFSNFIL